MFTIIYWRKQEGNEQIIYPVMEDWGAMKCFRYLTDADRCANEFEKKFPEMECCVITTDQVHEEEAEAPKKCDAYCNEQNPCDNHDEEHSHDWNYLGDGDDPTARQCKICKYAEAC